MGLLVSGAPCRGTNTPKCNRNRIRAAPLGAPLDQDTVPGLFQGGPMAPERGLEGRLAL